MHINEKEFKKARLFAEKLSAENARLRELLEIWKGLGPDHIYLDNCPNDRPDKRHLRDPKCPACRRLIELGD